MRFALRAREVGNDEASRWRDHVAEGSMLAVRDYNLVTIRSFASFLFLIEVGRVDVVCHLLVPCVIDCHS